MLKGANLMEGEPRGGHAEIREPRLSLTGQGGEDPPLQPMGGGRRGSLPALPTLHPLGVHSQMAQGWKQHMQSQDHFSQKRPLRSLGPTLDQPSLCQLISF